MMKTCDQADGSQNLVVEENADRTYHSHVPALRVRPSAVCLSIICRAVRRDAISLSDLESLRFFLENGFEEVFECM